jgi:hypothetical protein
LAEHPPPSNTRLSRRGSTRAAELSGQGYHAPRSVPADSVALVLVLEDPSSSVDPFVRSMTSAGN